MSKSRESTAPAAANDRPRRNFLVEFGALAAGAVGALVSLGAGLTVLLDPLIRKQQVPGKYRQASGGGQEGFVRVATLDAVPDDGVPRRFPVLADQLDAWNFAPNQPIGAVFLRREAGSSEVQVLHSTCPHAGCAVTFKAADAEQSQGFYHCPCHNSAFALNGEKLDRPGKENPSPRPLDALEVDTQRLQDTGEVWIKFLDFYTGRPDMKPKI